MLELFSVIVPGESIGIHSILFIVATLLFWLFIVFSTSDNYDMSYDVLASLERPSGFNLGELLRKRL